MDVILEPKRITKFFTFFVILFSILHILGQCVAFTLGREGATEPFIRLTNLDVERSIPTLFSFVLLLTCSFFLFIIASAKRKDGEGYMYWLVLSVIFLFLSIDESLMTHEGLMEKLRTLLNTSGYFYFAWVIPYGIGLIAFLLVYTKFLFKLPYKTRLLFIIAGSVYISGAIGLELVGGRCYELYGEHSLSFVILFTIEEILEMSGTVLFIYALTSYMDSELKCSRFRIMSVSDESHNCTGKH
ncbi:MAG: hypothetical protein HOI47_08110 [Candidatus Scalindua sp.]|nr:hypothetical protein [Candidatus Scalindua sp.]